MDFPTKVLHVSAAPGWRGGEQQMAYLMEGLAARGVQNRVVGIGDTPLAQYAAAQEIPFEAMPFRGSTDLRTAWKLRTVIKRWQPDIVHIHEAKAHALAVYAHALGAKVPLVLSRKIDFQLRTNPLTKWKYNYSGIRKILCVSEKVQAVVQAILRDPSRAVVVPDGIDPARFSHAGPYTYLRTTYGVGPDALLIGNTSALVGHKDYFTFLNTAKRLLASGLKAHFFIMGSGELEPDLRNHAASLGIQDRVSFTGFLANIPEVLPELDVFLMTSEEEGMGSSLLDAYCVGVPVVATQAGGIPEVVVHEQTGLLAPVHDHKALAEAVLRVVDEPALAERLTAAAATRLQEYFTADQLTANTLAQYRNVVGL